MEPTNIKVGEYVGVYHDSKDGSFYFDTISAEEYDTAKQDSSASKSLFHRMLDKGKRNYLTLKKNKIFTPWEDSLSCSLILTSYMSEETSLCSKPNLKRDVSDALELIRQDL